VLAAVRSSLRSRWESEGQAVNAAGIQPQKIEVALARLHAAFAAARNLGAESLQLLEKALGPERKTCRLFPENRSLAK